MVPLLPTAGGASLLTEDIALRFQTVQGAVQLVLWDSPRRTELGRQAKVKVIAMAGLLEQQSQNEILRF